MRIETKDSLAKHLTPVVGWAASPREESNQNNTTPRKWNPEHPPEAEGDGSNKRTIRYRMRQNSACFKSVLWLTDVALLVVWTFNQPSGVLAVARPQGFDRNAVAEGEQLLEFSADDPAGQKIPDCAKRQFVVNEILENADAGLSGVKRWVCSHRRKEPESWTSWNQRPAM
jgi:hypothetical protein